ncbi:hypothetical protein Tco_0669325 [Tanacetum coccineum]
MVKNRDGESCFGKDGKPMMAARRMQFDAFKSEGSLDDSVTSINASTLIRCDSRTTFQWCMRLKAAKKHNLSTV